MAGRAHFAAPLLLAVVVALILYVSLWPFRFGADGPGVVETLRQLTWARAGIPMLPVAYGIEFTGLHILLYTILLVIVTLLPYLTGMSGLVYLASAVVLGTVFVRHAVALRRPDAAPQLPMKVFRYSINYLMLLFAALLVDHYLPRWP